MSKKRLSIEDQLKKLNPADQEQKLKAAIDTEKTILPSDLFASHGIVNELKKVIFNMPLPANATNVETAEQVFKFLRKQTPAFWPSEKILDSKTALENGNIIGYGMKSFSEFIKPFSEKVIDINNSLCSKLLNIKTDDNSLKNLIDNFIKYFGADYFFQKLDKAIENNVSKNTTLNKIIDESDTNVYSKLFIFCCEKVTTIFADKILKNILTNEIHKSEIRKEMPEIVDIFSIVGLHKALLPISASWRYEILKIKDNNIREQIEKHGTIIYNFAVGLTMNEFSQHLPATMHGYMARPKSKNPIKFKYGELFNKVYHDNLYEGERKAKSIAREAVRKAYNKETDKTIKDDQTILDYWYFYLNEKRKN